MKCKISSLAAILSLTLMLLAVGSAVAQEEKDKPKNNDSPKTEEKKSNSTASVRIMVSAEGKSSLPSGSRIEWKSLDDNGEGAAGTKNLESSGATSLSLPVCKVKVWVFVTGFDTKAVMLDLNGKEDKYNDLISIKVKRQGPAQVEW
jgi:hypothetical protein